LRFEFILLAVAFEKKILGFSTLIYLGVWSLLGAWSPERASKLWILLIFCEGEKSPQDLPFVVDIQV
jgi:hypothetical protein